MSVRIKEGVRIAKNVVITYITLPFVPLIIKFFLQIGKNVGYFIKNLYFFVVK